MGVGSGLYVHVRCSRKTFTFAISSSDELLSSHTNSNCNLVAAGC